MPLLVAERRGFVVFSVQQQLPHLRQYLRDLGGLEGPAMRRIQQFVAERNLFGVGVASQLDVQAPLPERRAPLPGARLQKPLAAQVSALSARPAASA
jgi:hypothetical protein